jgi:ABC-type amino acid transport substrate-binding protein
MFPAERTQEEEALAQRAAEAYVAVFPSAGPQALGEILTKFTPAEAEEWVAILDINPALKRDRIDAAKQLMARAYDRRREADQAKVKAEKSATEQLKAVVAEGVANAGEGELIGIPVDLAKAAAKEQGIELPEFAPAQPSATEAEVQDPAEEPTELA